ncbi:MAG TPA: glycosyltransferase family 39 protein, partial [Chloroflexota bacterium]|nr:glycosyltransferase family 39 protein [Chloroflexota bacterium]
GCGESGGHDVAAVPVVAGRRMRWRPDAGVAIGIGALALRLLHVGTGAKLVLADDAVFFEQHAQAFLAAWRAAGQPESGALLRDAIDNASLQGVLYPLTLSGIYLVAGGVNHVAAAVAQGVMGAFTVWLLFLTARRAFGQGAGVAAGLLAAVYPPLVLTSGVLLAEATLLAVQAGAAYLLVRSLGRGAMGSRVLAGLTVGVLMLRPAFQHAGMLSMASLAGAAIAARRRLRGAVGLVAPFAGGLALVALPWLALNGLVFGQAVWSRTGDAWQQVYWGIYPPNRGWWPPDSPVPPKYGVESLPGARAAGMRIEVRDLDYLQAAVDQVRATPLQALATEVNKLVHAYRYPFNTYAERVPLVGWLAAPMHRALVWLALLGVCLAPRAWGPSLALAGLGFGVSLPFLASHIDVRYVIPIMLLALPFAGHAVSVGLTRMRASTTWREALLPAAAVGVTAVAAWADVPIITAPLRDLAPVVAHALHGALLISAVILAGAAIGWWIGAPKAAFGAAAAVAAASLIQACYQPEWHEWSTVIRPGEIAAQRIDLPGGWTFPSGARAEVRLYAQGPAQQSYVPRVLVNGNEITRLGPAFTEGGPLRFEERLMVTARLQGKARAEVPQWYGVPLELSALSADKVDVAVTLDGAPGDWIRVWGDYYPVLRGRGYLETPSIHSRIQGQDDSFHKLVSTGHPRLWRRFELRSLSARARIESGGLMREDDLSPAVGRQTGELRLRILVFAANADLVAIF